MRLQAAFFPPEGRECGSKPLIIPPKGGDAPEKALLNRGEAAPFFAAKRPE